MSFVYGRLNRRDVERQRERVAMSLFIATDFYAGATIFFKYFFSFHFFYVRIANKTGEKFLNLNKFARLPFVQSLKGSFIMSN